MLMETTTVNRATKDILAKCMATEDLRVIHDATAETAYFDTENRVLCLPVWKDMSNSTYDMLVGHEVSHALHTPKEGWQDFVGDGKGSRIRHMFINVVEDARIERLIKDKFPGLKRDFAIAYGELHTQDLFQLKNRNIDTDMPLIDRLNLHFKLGLFGLETIPFATDEQQYVTRMAETLTFEEVVKLAEDLYGKHQDELEEEDENQPQSGSEAGEGEEGESEEGSESGQSNDDTGEEQDGSQSGSEAEEGDDEDGSESGESQQDGDEAGEGDDDETGDGQSSLDYDDYQEGCGTAGSTQNALENAVTDMRDSNSSGVRYHTLPSLNLDNCVVGYKEIDTMWEEYYTMCADKSAERVAAINKKTDENYAECAEFLQRTKTTVAQMVQHFQMKQAANADKRTNISKTGVLDTCSMINYRWSEDIFLKNETHEDGKNHGIVMYLDWSGSMNNILRDTVEQLLILTQFCQKVNIPFDVYAFTSNQLKGLDENGNSCGNSLQTDRGGKDVLNVHSFSLMQFLSSDMKSNEYKLAVKRLFHLALANSNYYGNGYPHQMGLGCTPLNEAIQCALEQVPAFQAKHGVEIVNTVFLTDGDGHSMGARGHYDDKTIIHDPKTRKDYDRCNSGYDGETQTYLRILRDRTGTNLIGIRLSATRNVSSLRYRYFPEDETGAKAKQWKANNFIAIDGQGYDKLFIVKGNLKVETEALESLDADASYAKIKNAFMKGSNNQKSSRVIATQMVDIIAV
jgi:hypothetical protein